MMDGLGFTLTCILYCPPLATIYDVKWVQQNDIVGLSGSCGSVTTVLINVSNTGCFISGTPDVAISIYDRPNTSSTVVGTLALDSNFEVMGETTDGWYGVLTSSADQAQLGSGGYGALGLDWVRIDSNPTLSPTCGDLPTIY